MMKRIMYIFSDSFQIGKKDILDFVRDRAMLVSFVVMPLFMMIMMGYIFPSQNSLKNISLGIANKDRGELSQGFVKAMKSFKVEDSEDKAFDIKTIDSTKEAKDKIKSQDISGAIVIDSSFSENLVSGKQADITLVLDESNPQVSSLLTSVLKEIVNAMSTKAGAKNVAKLIAKPSIPTNMENIQSQKLSVALDPNVNPTAIVRPFTLKTEGVVPGKPNYFQFMAPGIMAMVVVMAVMMGLAGSVAREKERGTLDGILVAPISRISVILGKTLSQTARGLLQGTIVLVLAILLFGVKVYGSLALVALLLILGIFSFIGLGILISAVVSEQETAMTVMMTFTFPMIFLSGAFFPTQQMPQFMQSVSRVLPLTYMIEALRKVIVLGAGISSVSTEVTILLSFGLVMLAFAVPAFNRVITR
jgi:ABC-2 type transport system permease protein